MFHTFNLHRSKRSLRNKRHFINYTPVNITEFVNRDYLKNLINNLDFRDGEDEENRKYSPGNLINSKPEEKIWAIFI